MRSLLAASHARQWFYPGPLRVFTPEEMARAGMQPWPVAVDSYVGVNLLVLLPAMLWSRDGDRAGQAFWWGVWCALAVGALAISRSLWRRPTRARLNLYCYGVALGIAAAGTGLARRGHHDWLLRENIAIVACLTGVLSAWWMLTVFRVQQIEGRLRELADQAGALRLSTRLAAAQIQPHFLFNTLASLQHWVDTGDARAAPLLRDFTAYLRATLPMFERELHPLADELEMVRRYLAIMQARLGPRLSFHVDAPGDVQAQLPPGLLLTLAENAITHGIEPQLGGGRIDVRVASRPGRIELGVQDSGGGLPPQWTEGVGLANTRRRLLGAFPDATLTLTPTDTGCLALLTLPSP